MVRKFSVQHDRAYITEIIMSIYVRQGASRILQKISTLTESTGTAVSGAVALGKRRLDAIHERGITPARVPAKNERGARRLSDPPVSIG